MTKRDRRRIVRELCRDLQGRLLRNVEKFPAPWDGKHIRALAWYLLDSNTDTEWFKKAFRQMRTSDAWYALPL